VLPAGFSGDVGLFVFVLQPAAGLPLLHPPMGPATEPSNVNSANDNPTRNISAGPVAKEYLPVNDGGRFGYAGSEQACELLGRHRRAEKVPLRFVTLVSLKKHQLFLSFHALSNDPQLQASAHADHRRHDGRLAGGGGDLTDERLVDLEGIDGKPSKVAQTRVTRAEVNYTEWKFSKKDFLSVRPIDYIVDFKGERSGFATTMASWTVGVTHRFNELVSVRPEARYEYAFSARPWDNGTRKGQLMFAMDAVMRF
jgi:hypothetical protein